MNKKEPEIQPFIFNWRNQFDNAKSTYEDLCKIFNKVNVINSDESNEPSEWENVGNDYWFGGQFKKAMEMFTGDVLMHIQADASYNNWGELIVDAKKYFSQYKLGVYAPNVDYTWWNSNKADINDKNNILDHTNLKLVCNTDCTVWFIHKEALSGVATCIENISDDHLGAGIDTLIIANSMLKKRLVIRDYNHKISHPKSTGYNTNIATKEKWELINSAERTIKRVSKLIDRRATNLLYQYYI